MVRQLFYAAFADLYWRGMMGSTDATLAAIAAKSEKECAYHLRHSSEWVIRLGDGTEESHARTARALDDLWMYTGELFEMGEGERALAESRIAVERTTIRASWDATIDATLAQAALQRPADRWMQSGGRSGRHSEHLGPLLAEMQVLNRAHAGVTW
jgi:ring-1,2-phenylacetyl-CoA epoxidase subunit PaaC